MNAKLIQDLVDVGTGKLKHLYRGRCPDAVEGQQARDSGCPACKVLIAGVNAVKEQEKKRDKEA